MDSKDLKVSVIVPVYNGEKYIEECMDSIVGQTLREIEIICVDDGSTDGSPEILERFRRQDKRVRLISQENAGAGAARNRGFKEAGGEYLSFLDADDFFEPDMLETAYRKAKEQKAQILVFGSDQYRTHTDMAFQVSP